MSFVVKRPNGLYVSGRGLFLTEDLQDARVYLRKTDAKNSTGASDKYIVPVKIVEVAE